MVQYMSVLYVRVDTHVRVQKIMHVSTCIRMSIHSLSIRLCVRIAMYTCTYACVHVCAYTPPSSYIRTSTCRDTHVTMYMYVHAHVHVQSCVCVCALTLQAGYLVLSLVLLSPVFPLVPVQRHGSCFGRVF